MKAMSKSFAVSDVGRHRRINQDSVFASDGPVGLLPDLYLVADGMGGHKGGEYASSYTRDRLIEICRGASDPDPDAVIPYAFSMINAGLRAIAASDFRYSGMGTTAVCAVVVGDAVRGMTLNGTGDRMSKGTVMKMTVVFAAMAA